MTTRRTAHAYRLGSRSIPKGTRLSSPGRPRALANGVYTLRLTPTAKRLAFRPGPLRVTLTARLAFEEKRRVQLTIP